MVLSVEDDRWNEYLKKMPVKMQDIYFTSQYHKLCMGDEDTIPEMFVCQGKNGELGLYPFLRRPISKAGQYRNYFDMETVYGYGGPLINTDNTDFIKQFEDEFLEYCQEKKIIAEFIRFHPLIKNESVFNNKIEILHNRFTVELNLTWDLQDIWMHSISRQNRNIIRKCYKNGLSVEQGYNYNTFMDIYYETMEHVHADAFYFWGEDYFKEISSDSAYILLNAVYESKIVASAIFIGYGEYFHYHLSGSRRAYLNMCPNNILLWEAIKFAKEKGYKRMHFGGGRTDSCEDSLFKFKNRFSTDIDDFYIGKRIHNNAVYRDLIQQWEDEHNKKAHILLQYRERQHNETYMCGDGNKS